MKSFKPNYLRVFSDIHLDFDISTVPGFFKFEKLWMPEPMETDKETALVLAGDLWHAKKPFSFFGKSWIREISTRFQYVIIVLGNHDFWDGNIEKEYKNYRKSIASQELLNVFLLQNTSLYFDGLKIVGATLWTDFLQANPVCMKNAAYSGMKDYQYIHQGIGLKYVTPEKILQEHYLSKSYIFENSSKDYNDQKIMVITHHSPSYKSMPQKYNKPELKIENALYYSNLDNLIESSEIDLWVHGHSHFAMDYKINKTNVLANPRGYSEQETGYNPWLLINSHTLKQI